MGGNAGSGRAIANREPGWWLKEAPFRRFVYVYKACFEWSFQEEAESEVDAIFQTQDLRRWVQRESRVCAALAVAMCCLQRLRPERRRFNSGHGDRLHRSYDSGSHSPRH